MQSSISEFRHDPIQKRWVIIATERNARPDDFYPDQNIKSDKEECPFCNGSEDQTPNEIVAVRSNGGAPNSPDWKVRVVPNRYPALSVQPEDIDRSANGIYDRMHGIGAHEVIIESPEHSHSLPDLPIDHAADIFRIYRDRSMDLMQDRRLRYVLIFKNQGANAGATLSHPHSQIIATPVTPRNIVSELKSCHEHFQGKERCLICDIVKQETSDGKRVIYNDGKFIAFTPYASRFPFELFIAPLKHSHQFGDTSDDDIESLTVCMQNVLQRMKSFLDDPPFNFVIHTAPNLKAFPPTPDYWSTLDHYYHWHIELFPRLTRVAGFEWGTDFYINPTSPEEAAKLLREVKV